jgi:uncharacterized protein (TIGR02145 family)
MEMKCKIGIHNWDGCQCTNCGKIRNEHHDLSKDCETCAKCGTTIANHHDWSHDCERCHKCGKTRKNEHSWTQNCEMCSKCGQKRYDMHHMENGMCTICGHGIFKDESDGRSYKVIKIGDQVLMAENYAKKPAEGNLWAYDNKEENRIKYANLYDWETAKSIAPKGWHLPTKAEWEILFHVLGGHSKEVFEQLKQGGLSGFDGLLGGWRSIRGAFNGLGASAHFWCDTSEDENHAWQVKLGAYQHHAEFEKGEKSLGLSVRYFKDK